MPADAWLFTLGRVPSHGNLHLVPTVAQGAGVCLGIHFTHVEIEAWCGRDLLKGLQCVRAALSKPDPCLPSKP